MIPEIAVIGHPNEGKSSVLSTLAEDDSVHVSAFPGETTSCRSFPVVIDGKEIIRFTDTPGFQNPARLLAELQTLSGTGVSRLQHLEAVTVAHEHMREDHELLQPIIRGAGIIYVVDGSRPPRNVDRDEMELLRLLGRPRMAVLNCKRSETSHLATWKALLAEHCNAVRVFNAHRATYGERIALLESLKAIDQDWQQVLAEVIRAVEADWTARIEAVTRSICSMLTKSVALTLTAEIAQGAPEEPIRKQLVTRYTDSVAALEREAHRTIRTLFKHNIFNYELSPYSILHEELFSEKTWHLLGLTTKQFILLGAAGGTAIGAGIDIAALGHGLGLFTGLGTVAGTLGALTSRKHLDVEASLLGIRLAGRRLRIGPAGSVSLLLVLVNRALLFYRHIINWAHGRRDQADPQEADNNFREKPGFTSAWSAAQLKVCQRFLKTAPQPESEEHQSATIHLQEILVVALMEISLDTPPGRH